MALTSDKAVLLHGDLDLTIFGARHLPNMDLFVERLRRCFRCCGLPFPRPTDTRESPLSSPTRDHDHAHRTKIITSDPYTKVLIAGATVARTCVIPNTQDPVWNQRFRIPLAHRAAQVEFQVKDNDMFGAEVMGTATVSAALVASGRPFEMWLPIIGPSGQPLKPGCTLRVYF